MRERVGAADRDHSVAHRRLLTVKEAAAFMQVRPKSVYAWVAAGRLPCLRAGNRIRFRLSDLESWLSGGSERSA